MSNSRPILSMLDDEVLLVRNAYPYRQQLKALGARWSPEQRVWLLPVSVSPFELFTRVPNIELDKAAMQWLQRMASLAGLHNAEDVSITHGDRLLPYQRVGVKFLTEAKRAILADDVGLGKTAQAIRAALEINAKHVLVVTKKSLLHNWTCEIQRWAGCSAYVLTTQNTFVPERFVVTNYETVIKRTGELIRQDFDVLVVDEAAAIKNRKARRTKAIYQLAKNIPYVWLLTATPTPNSPDEIWSLLHCIRPKAYSSYWSFVEKHFITRPNFFGGRDIVSVKNPDALAQELAPMVLRRDKTRLNLPPLTEETIWLSLDGEQRRIYRELRQYFVTILDEEKVVTAPSVLAQLTRLRQVLCSPALIGGPDESIKTDALFELLEEYTPQHKVLVFTTFASYVKLLLPKLEQFGAVAITGDTPMHERAQAVERLNNDPNTRVFIGTIQAAGEGLNLQAADIVIFLNKSWVPSENETQAIGRAHRQGQKNPVHVVNLVVAKTVDEYIEEVLAAKKQRTDAVLHIAERLRSERG